jgi:hypothetical protein
MMSLQEIIPQIIFIIRLRASVIEVLDLYSKVTSVEEQSRLKVILLSRLRYDYELSEEQRCEIEELFDKFDLTHEMHLNLMDITCHDSVPVTQFRFRMDYDFDAENYHTIRNKALSRVNQKVMKALDKQSRIHHAIKHKNEAKEYNHSRIHIDTRNIRTIVEEAKIFQISVHDVKYTPDRITSITTTELWYPPWGSHINEWETCFSDGYLGSTQVIVYYIHKDDVTLVLRDTLELHNVKADMRILFKKV